MPGPNFDEISTRFTATTPAVIVGGLGGLIVSYLYFFLSWRSAGKATPGQRIFKMQVGNAFDGAALTARPITIRWLTLFGLGILSIVPLLGGLGGLATIIWDIVLLVTTASSPTKQGMQDRWAGSAVVATGPQNTGLAWGCLIAYIVGILAIIVIAIFALLAIFAAFYNLAAVGAHVGLPRRPALASLRGRALGVGGQRRCIRAPLVERVCQIPRSRLHCTEPHLTGPP